MGKPVANIHLWLRSFKDYLWFSESSVFLFKNVLSWRSVVALKLQTVWVCCSFLCCSIQKRYRGEKDSLTRIYLPTGLLIFIICTIILAIKTATSIAIQPAGCCLLGYYLTCATFLLKTQWKKRPCSIIAYHDFGLSPYSRYNWNSSTGKIYFLVFLSSI